MAAIQLVFSQDYPQRVYAGVLGKIIGVYLGRPCEGVWYDEISQRFGEVTYYVNGVTGHPLIAADDDISGTFCFFRALEDHGYDRNLTSEQIGRGWLNYIIENKTILWWGGVGMCTEHTAFSRLKQGIPGPRSGSIETNGQLVAEQIGAQIFIDAWGLVTPGNPEIAGRLAKAAGSVSHDGEAIYGAIIIAALVSLAFVEKDISVMLDRALEHIPEDSLVARMIADIRRWVKEDRDWRKTRERIDANYGYDKYGGGCHIIPNHALVILALLYAPDDFSEALKIVNTCGWDTDCNSANVGSIMGVRVGLEGMQKRHDWRGPVADRLFIPTADGGRAITDAVIESQRIIKAAYALAGKTFDAPKAGARWHFSFPGSVQGFNAIPSPLNAPTAVVTGAASPFAAGAHCLSIQLIAAGEDQLGGAQISTFFSNEEYKMTGYALCGTPVVYPTQEVSATVMPDRNAGNIRVRLACSHYDREDKTRFVHAEWTELKPGVATRLGWQIPDLQGSPIQQLRLECLTNRAGSVLYLDSMDIARTPSTRLIPEEPSTAPAIRWTQAWVGAVDRQGKEGPRNSGWCLIQDEGYGCVSTGNEVWKNYRFEATLHANLADAFGVCVAYRGLLRQVCFTLNRDGLAKLEQLTLAGEELLATAKVPFTLLQKYKLAMEWRGETVRCFVDDKQLLEAKLQTPVEGGGVAIVLKTGRIIVDDAKVTAL